MDISEKIAIGSVSLVAFVIFAVIALLLFGFGFPYSGEQTGYITAVERGGMFNIPNVYIKTETESSQEERYCLAEELFQEAQKLSKEKKLVTVSYSRGFFMPFWSCNLANDRIIEIE